MPIQIFPDLSEISSRFKGVLLDAYGVFWGGNGIGLLPGAREKMESLVLQGKTVGILSNSTQLPAKEADKYFHSGIEQGKHYHFLLTSGGAARDLFLNRRLPFETPRSQFWLFGKPHPKFSSHEAIFRGTSYKETSDIHQADFIYLSIPHRNGEDQIDPGIFREELEQVKLYQLPMVCANPDQFAHEGSPSCAVVRQGSIAALYENMGGQVVYIGKPYPLAYAMALEQFQLYGLEDPAMMLMVGDTPETDIRGACRIGMPSALVTQSGIMGDRVFRSGLEKALNDLPASDKPTYLIERFQ